VAANKYTAVRWFYETGHQVVSLAAPPPLLLQLLQRNSMPVNATTLSWARHSHYHSTTTSIWCMVPLYEVLMLMQFWLNRISNNTRRSNTPRQESSNSCSLTILHEMK